MMKTNFHTHTFRCGHAVGNEEAMVKSAIEEGIEVLGFSEHVPLPRYRKHIFKGMRYTLNHFRSFAVACKAIITNGGIMERHITVLFFCIGCGGLSILISSVGSR